ncbi:AMP-dependent synthetase/ligase [Thermoflavifilum thermophilum]|uniref:Long-chain acyl-CoA synthetase n=1 Tax=Thermoflavifilum thermophilum TaxID=1393122 RepID=A0A1I7NBC3_9BACT|nr:long-chain fatty acid--CoA ligase [Thermoflavifilum thermophilum]SFV31974.1 long-chain acyl-CoA synthetase [Thermoflavifilum thermophilum]
MLSPSPSRLFDLAFQHFDHPLPDMLAAKENGRWRSYSTQAVIELSQALARGMQRAGISPNDFTPEHQDKIGLISANRPEWVITDLACQLCGAVLVPVYPTISQNELSFVLQDAAVKIVFTGDAQLYEKVQQIKDQLPALQAIYCFEQNPKLPYWKQLLCEEGQQQLEQTMQQIRDDHLATIIYTSGTTGIPKGVMLSHRNIVSNVLACRPILPLSKNARALSFLPLNHVYERMITYLYIHSRVPIYYAESMDKIGENLKEVRPTIFTTVPRLLEKLYERIVQAGMQLHGIKRAIFFWALGVAKRYQLRKHQPLLYALQLKIADKLVFSKWRAALGGRIQAVVIGSAPAQIRLMQIFTAAGIPCLEGYGLTETSPVISVNRLEIENRMFGTVGPVIDGVEVKIAPDGEILCKGPNVMMGYYKRPDLTAEVMEDGWLHTGDVGEIINGKFLKITDRKKELLKTSGGKYVAPQPIENKLKESRFIEQVMVVGEGRKFVSALIVPSFAHLKDWCVKNNIPFDKPEDVIQHPQVKALYQSILDKYNPLFNHVEQIKKFVLLPHEWTIEGGELTPTLKLKRKAIEAKYHELIEQIYHSEK